MDYEKKELLYGQVTQCIEFRNQATIDKMHQQQLQNTSQIIKVRVGLYNNKFLLFDDPEQCYNMLKKGVLDNCYEYYNKEQRVKLFIDYDCKKIDADITQNTSYEQQYEEKKLVHMSRIKNIILFISQFISVIVNKNNTIQSTIIQQDDNYAKILKLLQENSKLQSAKNIQNEIQNNIVILESNNQMKNKKISYHVIFNNIEMENIVQMGQIMKYIKNIYNKKDGADIFQHVDMNPYNKSGLMRLHLSTKDDNKNDSLQLSIQMISYLERQHIKVYQDLEQEIYDEQNDEDEDYDTLNVFKMSLITYIQQNIQMFKIKMKMQQTNWGRGSEQNERIDLPIEYDLQFLQKVIMKLPEEWFINYYEWQKVGQVLYNHYIKQIQIQEDFTKHDEMEQKYLQLYEEFSKQSGEKYEPTGCMIQWNKFQPGKRDQPITIGSLIYELRKSDQQIKSGIFTKQNKINIERIKNQTKLACMMQKMEKKKQKIQKQFINDQFDDGCKQLKYKDSVFDIQYHWINENKIDYKKHFIPINLGINNKITGIKSEKSTGKSTQFFPYFFENIVKNQEKVLIITSRVSLAHKILGDIDELKYFKIYDSEKQRTLTAPRMIIQINSLYRIPINYIYDHIIIDEAKGFATYLTSNHYIKQENTELSTKQFEWFVKQCKKIFLLDADLDYSTLKYFSQICMQNPIKSKNIQQNYFNTIQLFDNKFQTYKEEGYCFNQMDEYQFFHYINKDIQQDKKIAIISQSQNFANLLYQYLIDQYQSKKIMVLTGQTDQQYKNTIIADVNTYWKDQDIIIYTPTITMGVSYDIEDDIQQIYCYMCDNSAGVLELLQMGHRIRQPVSKQINFYYSIRNCDINEDFDFSDNQIANIMKSKLYVSMFDIQLKRLQYDFDYQDSKVIIQYVQNQYYFLYRNNIREQLMNRLIFFEVFYTYIQKKGYQFNIQQDKNDGDIDCSFYEQFKEHKKQQNAQIKQNQIKNIQQAILIDKKIIYRILELQKHNDQNIQLIHQILKENFQQQERDRIKKKFEQIDADLQEYIIEQQDNKLTKIIIDEKFKEKLSHQQIYDKYKQIKIQSLVSDSQIKKQRIIDIYKQYEDVDCCEEEYNYIMSWEFLEKYSANDKMRKLKNLRIILSTEKNTTKQKINFLRKVEQQREYDDYFQMIKRRNKASDFDISIHVLDQLGLDINNDKSQVFTSKLYGTAQFNKLSIFLQKNSLKLQDQFQLKQIVTNGFFQKNSNIISFCNSIVGHMYGLQIKNMQKKGYIQLDYSKTWKDYKYEIIPTELKLNI